MRTKRQTKERKAMIEKSRQRLQKALKKTTKLELLRVILASLDCPSHFHKPVIKGATFKKHKDEDYSYGDNAIVLCGHCVDRLRAVLCLEPGEPCPSSFQYEGWRAVNGLKSVKVKNR